MISRGKGQSAVASASYRSGEALYSELDIETKSYGKRTVQPDTFIDAPEHAPEWVYNRERLWNEVEFHENKLNSQLAREVRVALPIEIDHETQKKLLQEYVKENFVNRGMVADVSIHRDIEHNPHAHILLTIRPFDENGEWGSKQKREYLKDENDNFIYDDKGKKKFKKVELTDWNSKSTLLEWRKNCAEIINHYYKENDIPNRVSHESYKARGIEKSPLQRLNRIEYNLEKEEQEKAKSNNEEYVPITRYGQINYERQKANRELEFINQKIVDLQEYREKVKSETEKELNKIRDNAILSKEDWDAVKVVVARTKGFVNLEVAKDTVKRVDFWKQKLDNQRLDIDSFGKTLASANTLYQNNPKDVLKYGFIPSEFENQYSTKKEEYKSMIEDFNKKTMAYNELNQHSRRAYTLQKSFVDEEFKFLYPKYQDINTNNDKISDLKSYYVDLFRKEGVVRYKIPELELDSYKYSDVHVKSEFLLKDWKNNVNSLVILERTKRKLQNEFNEHFKDWDAEKVFQKSVQFTKTNEQISSKENVKEKLTGKLDEHLKVLYPDVTNDSLSLLPPESKARVLELNVKDESTGIFTKDLMSIEKEIKEDLHKFGPKKFEENGPGPYIHSASASAGDLFNNIVFTSHQNQERDNDLERRRKRAKKRNSKAKKNHRDIGENEL